MKNYFYTKMRHKFITSFLITLSIFTIITGCGSGGGGGGSLITESNGSGSTPEQSLILSWDEPADNENVNGYKIYYGSTSGNYISAEDIGNVTTYTFSYLQGNTICLALTAYNSSGHESGYSNEVCI